MYHLIVVHPFKNYEKGTKITDADEVEKVLASPQHHFVVKIAAPAAPVTSTSSEVPSP